MEELLTVLWQWIKERLLLDIPTKHDLVDDKPKNIQFDIRWRFP